MIGLTAEIEPIYAGLREIGYPDDHLVRNYPSLVGATDVSLLSFAARPFDSRTASVAVIQRPRVETSDIADLRPLGAPVVFARLPEHFEFWSQGESRPVFQQRIRPQQVSNFLRKNRAKLAPDRLYRAKVWGRLDHSYQLDFVDAGFLPVIEEEAGRKLTDLIGRVVSDARKALGWKDTDITVDNGRWLLQSTFWLLAAKILQDKQVNGFRRLKLAQIEEVYQRLASHYDSKSPRPVAISSHAKHKALVAAAEEIARFGNCSCVSTESLAYLYESALIDKVTRSQLGTHSTPTWLVDYIVGRLRPWIEEIPVDDRQVFEPACGHAGFLVSSMRLLSELLPSDWQESRCDYLRRRLHGLERDSFALEIARLSLTLADVPNPNGWALTEGDMFSGTTLEDAVRRATIVLGNPPFEDFKAEDRGPGWLPNRATEAFRRVIENLPHGGVFGFVLPQTFLRSKQAVDLRRKLLSDYEIAEIDLFADKVFRYGESESTAIIGRRTVSSQKPQFTVLYQRVREGHLDSFRRDYKPGNSEHVPMSVLAAEAGASLLVPDLSIVWKALSGLPEIQEFADVGKGLEHRSNDDPRRPPNSIAVSDNPVSGLELVPGFAVWNKEQLTHSLPRFAFLSLDPSLIRRQGLGTTTGKPQVLLNYARVSREPWTLEALIDSTGHPASSSFNIVRPVKGGPNLQVLWAIFNSPIANAFAYCMSGKRHVLSQYVRELPVPHFGKVDLRALEAAVVEYFNAVQREPGPAGKRKQKVKEADPRQRGLFTDGKSVANTEGVYSNDDLKALHWRIDAEVLRLYSLPPSLERQVLDLFSGIRRRGVPFEQTEYFPRDFADLDRLQDLLAITVDWPKTNRRRGRLIDLEEEGNITPEQQAELDELQRLADARVAWYHPVQIEGADQIIEQLKRAGKWEGSI